MHLPERALGGGGLGRLGGELGVRVDVVERQVAPDVAQVVAEVESSSSRITGSAWPQYGHSKSPYSTQRHGRVVGAADVVALGVDVLGEVEQVVGGAARSGARAPRRAAARSRGRRPRPSSGATSAAGEHAELRLLELLAVEGEARDQQRDGEADAGDRRRRRRAPAS